MLHVVNEEEETALVFNGRKGKGRERKRREGHCLAKIKRTKE